MQQRNSPVPYKSQQQQTNRNSNIYWDTSKELNTTSRSSDQQSRSRNQQFRISTSMLTATGLDAMWPGSQQQASSSQCWEQQSTTAAEHKQQLHSQAQKQSCMQSTREQQKHYILGDFVRNLPTSRRSTFESTQIHQVARAWQQGSVHLAKQSTLNFDICSYNNLSHWTLCASSRSTQTTIQQTSSPSMSQQRHYNDTSTMLDCISNISNHNIQQQATAVSPTL